MSSSTSVSEKGPGAFLRRTLLFGALVVTVLVCCALFGPPASPSEYMVSTIMKNRALDEAVSPKVVLVGGSNLSFGVNSEGLSKAFCRPVVNMGLTVPLGFRFIANEVKGRVRKGDVVVLALENGFYAKPDRIEDVTIAVVDYRPASMAFVPWRDRPRVIGSLAVMRLQAIKDYVKEAYRTGWEKPGYRKRVFNAHGDLVNHLDEPIPVERTTAAGELDTLIVDPAFWPIAEGLRDHARSVGAELVFSWPSVAATHFRAGENERLEKDLADRGFLIAGHAAGYTFPDSLFFDTWYHLHNAGREQRTERMIRDLCNVIDSLCCQTTSSSKVDR